MTTLAQFSALVGRRRHSSGRAAAAGVITAGGEGEECGSQPGMPVTILEYPQIPPWKSQNYNKRIQNIYRKIQIYYDDL